MPNGECRVTSNDFTDFYSASFTRVSMAARAFCGNADVAHESTQEAFARAYARWGRLRRAASPEGWVTKTALNLTRRHFRRRTGAVAREGAMDALAPSDDRLDLLTALRSLPERQRQAMVLHYLTDCPVAAVAELLGLSESTVKTHLHRGRAALHDLLEVRHA